MPKRQILNSVLHVVSPISSRYNLDSNAGSLLAPKLSRPDATVSAVLLANDILASRILVDIASDRSSALLAQPEKD
jgi:hypothetical protein